MREHFRCELVSWHQVHRLALRLALSVRDSGFEPEVIVAIARGGYVPARLLCDFLDIAALESLRVQHYLAGWRKQERARLLSTLDPEAIRNRRVLVVDDVTDTGDTLEVMQEYMLSLQPAALKVAVLHHKKSSTLEPDYYGQLVRSWRWLTYPWALVEDLDGFIRALPQAAATPQGLSRALASEFGVRISPRRLEEILPFIR